MNRGIPLSLWDLWVPIHILHNHLAYDLDVSFFDASDTVSIRTVNRQCSSGLQAVADVAAAIKVGYYDIGEDSWIQEPKLENKTELSYYIFEFFTLTRSVFHCRYWSWVGVHEY